VSEYQTVLFDLADGVATITLNRPEVMNAFNQQMLDEFSDIWKRCRIDDDVRVIVLRAAGGRAFSTGVDRKEGRTRHPNPWSADDPGFFLWINEADVVICSADATFFDPHTTYGMLSALEPAGLARRIPLGEAMRIALFGLDERMGAERAYGIGLVSEIVPGGEAELWDRAQVLAQRLADKPALAIQGTVKAVWDSLSMSPQAAREVPLVYPQLTNPLSQTEFKPGTSSKPEIR
jgi:enoyl-CoA hydratase/carnithine racemase